MVLKLAFLGFEDLPQSAPFHTTYMHHNTVELFVCLFRNSTITLSKVDIGRNQRQGNILQSCILDELTKHRNIMV